MIVVWCDCNDSIGNNKLELIGLSYNIKHNNPLKLSHLPHLYLMHDSSNRWAYRRRQVLAMLTMWFHSMMPIDLPGWLAAQRPHSNHHSFALIWRCCAHRMWYTILRANGIAILLTAFAAVLLWFLHLWLSGDPWHHDRHSHSRGLTIQFCQPKIKCFSLEQSAMWNDANESILPLTHNKMI